MTKASRTLVQAEPDVRFDRVLVPIDGTELSLAALPTARALAARFDAELHTITIVKPGQRVRRSRKSAIALDGDDASAGHAAFVSTSNPADTIAGYAAELGSCVVCMSTRSRGRIAGTALGSVSRSVVRQSGPTVIVGPLADRPGWSRPWFPWPPPLSTKRIVACVDGSAASEIVLPAAAAWSRRLGMSMAILTITDLWARGSTTGDRRSEAAEYVESLVADWQHDAVDVSGRVLADPIGPATAIRHYLEAHPAGLVAVSTAGSSGFRRLVRGSVADRLVRASVAPCLVVPQ